MMSEFCKEQPVAAGAFLELLEQVCREFIGGGPGVTACPLLEFVPTAGNDLEGVALAKLRCENRLERFKGRGIRGFGCSEGQWQEQDALKLVRQAIHRAIDIGRLVRGDADHATGHAAAPCAYSQS